MIQSGGALRNFSGVPRTMWSGTTDQITPDLASLFVSYDRIYERQPWVATLVDKISVSHARLPMKVYRRDEDGRPPSSGPYAELMRRPCPNLSNFDLWRWTTATLNIHGAAVWVKDRDRGGRPIAVHPWHPSRIEYDGTSDRFFLLDSFGARTREIARRDFVFFRSFNPRTPERGMSPLEPLRSTLENEYGAQRANSSMWRNGARPSVWLEHPNTLGPGVTERLAKTWDDTHGGVDNWSKAAVLEEGMTANVLPINYEELAYIDSRKLNRDECCSRFDIPPPVVHILDRATYSNITEQMRSMYRDSMGWRINHIEDTLDAELRDGSFGVGEPDFSPDEYGEFLMDEVLRGAFETRQEALQKADHMTIAEKRRLENLPYIEGTDRIFLNSATLPLTSDGELAQPVTKAEMPPENAARTVMGRLGRVADIATLDAAQLLDGVGEATAAVVRAVLAASEATDIATLRGQIRDALTEGGTDAA